MLIESKISSWVEEDEYTSLIKIHSDLKIFKEELPNGKEKFVKVGTALSYYFDVSNCINSNESIDDLFDLEGSFLEYYSLLYEEGFIKDEISEQMGDILNNNLFLIQKVEVKSKYRGNKYGQAAVIRLIQQFAHGVGLVVLKPFPLQYENSRYESLSKASKFKSFVKDEKQAFSKIRKYWEGIGFQKIGDSEIWGINPLYKQVTLAGIDYIENY